jgi:hypothetical protein
VAASPSHRPPRPGQYRGISNHTSKKGKKVKIVHRYNGITARLLYQEEDGNKGFLYESKSGELTLYFIQWTLWNDRRILLTGPLVRRVSGIEEGDAFKITVGMRARFSTYGVEKVGTVTSITPFSASALADDGSTISIINRTFITPLNEEGNMEEKVTLYVSVGHSVARPTVMESFDVAMEEAKRLVESPVVNFVKVRQEIILKNSAAS